MSNNIDVQFYVVIGSKVTERAQRLTYSKPSVRVTRNKPATDETEIFMLVNLKLPLSLFLKPTLTAKISVDGEKISPLVITPEMTDNIAAVVKERLGIHMSVSADDGT